MGEVHGDVLLDIEAVARDCGLDKAGGLSWFKYASREQEVIVRVPENGVMIRPEHVVGAWGMDAANIDDLFVPTVGEFVWDSEEDGLIIASYHGRCTETGCHIITTTSGKAMMVIWEAWCGWSWGCAPDTPIPGLVSQTEFTL